MERIEININLDRRCAECRRPGAADNGLCLPCSTKAITGGKMKSPAGIAAQQRMHVVLQREAKMDENKKRTCPCCNGSGAGDKPGYKCPLCHGTGQVHRAVQRGYIRRVRGARKSGQGGKTA